ncbi:WD40 repeat domain-containing protein [Nostoc sp.]|uniref:WD40 repeat domain-containing protein n=1 Tax=Nostoc sp. TaxID=1180 RepID=UPI002FF5967F
MEYIHLWDVNGQPIGQPFVRHDSEVNSVAFSPDGERIVSGSDDKTVRLWDVNVSPLVNPLLGMILGSIQWRFPPRVSGLSVAVMIRQYGCGM